MTHDWGWDGEPFEFDIAGKSRRFIGAWTCANCGMRLPCLDERMKQFMWEATLLPDDTDGCAMNIIDKVLSS